MRGAKKKGRKEKGNNVSKNLTKKDERKKEGRKNLLRTFHYPRLNGFLESNSNTYSTFISREFINAILFTLFIRIVSGKRNWVRIRREASPYLSSQVCIMRSNVPERKISCGKTNDEAMKFYYRFRVTWMCTFRMQPKETTPLEEG